MCTLNELEKLFIWSIIVSVGACCNFGRGPTCTFPCNCATSESCDQDTGACAQSGCAKTNPEGYGWGGPGCLVGNAAYLKLATQSGDYTNWNGIFYANLSVDGNTNTEFSAGFCSHTANGGAPRAWWQVDLGALHVIHNVTIYARDDIWGERRTNRLSILVGLTDTESDFTQCARLDQPVPAGGHQTFPCTQPLVGRYIKLLKDEGVPYDYNILNICETIVMGYQYIDCSECQMPCSDKSGCFPCAAGKTRPDCVQDCHDGRYGVNCEQSCHCRKNEEPCNVVDGACSSGCPDWFVEDACTIEITLPSMSAAAYTPTVSAFSHDSVTISWTKLGDVPDGKYYSYQVEYRSSDEDHFRSFAVISHIDGPREQATVIENLTLRTLYSFRVVPSRNINTDQYKNRNQEYGTVTSVISQTTVCPLNTYGEGCREWCFCRDSEERCDIDEGTCITGCRDWFVGRTCATEIILPDMSAEQYTPDVKVATQRTATIDWRMLESVPVEEYYFYQVELRKNGGQFEVVDTVTHLGGTVEQNTTITDLNPNTSYELRILPHRNISTDDYRNENLQPGIASQTLSVKTDAVSTTPAETPATSPTNDGQVNSEGCNERRSTVIVLSALVGVLAAGLLLTLAVFVIVIRKLKQQLPPLKDETQVVYYNTATSGEKESEAHEGAYYNEVNLPADASRKNDPTYTTPEPAYSLNQVSQYEDLRTNEDYEKI